MVLFVSGSQYEAIIAAHVSTCYHEQSVQRLVKKSLPDMLGGRLKLWL